MGPVRLSIHVRGQAVRAMGLLLAVTMATACAEGQVYLDCPGTKKACDGQCVEVSDNLENCGGCGQSCAIGQLCCDGACTDQVAKHCGACGQRCAAGSYCELGECKECSTDARCGPTCAPCSGAKSRCREGKCVECTLDAHCGATRFCAAGVCTACTRDDHCGPTCKTCGAGTSCNGMDCIVCATDLECGTAKYCLDHLCKPCNTDDHCGPGCERCGGTAKPFCNASATGCGECGNTGNCPLGKRCEDGVCLACTSPDHCGPLCAVCTGTALPYCSPTGCAECLKDTHCPPGNRCDSGACLPCNTPDFCGPSCAKCAGTPTPLCASASQGCVQCLLDPHCSEGSFCDKGVCVPCATDQRCGVACVACGGATPHCSTAAGKCVACLIGAHCPAGKYCQGGGCADCNTDDHCGASCATCPTDKLCNGDACVGCCGPTCLVCKTHEYCSGDACAVCNTDDHCGAACQACGTATPHCKAGATCVECLSASQCPPGEHCDADICQPCSNPSHCGPTCVTCTPDQTCCGPAQGCFDLMTDQKNCGTCGKACSTFCNKGLCDASIKCSAALGDDVYSTPAIDGAGNVYVVTSNGTLRSFKPDCTLRWSYATTHYTSASPVLSPDESTVYVATAAGPATLYALSTAAGTKTWSATIGAGWSDYDTPAVGSDGTIYAVGLPALGGPYNESVQAFTPGGSSKWVVSLSAGNSNIETGGPAVGGDGTIYAQATNGTVAAISPDGQIKWQVSLGCCNTNVSPAVGSDGQLYVVASSGKTLYKLNSASGATLWSRTLGSVTVSHVSPVTDGQGNVYLALPNGTVQAYGASGSPLWSVPAFGAYNATLALGSDGVLYAINGSNGSLRALSSATGTVLWSLQIGNALSSSPNLSKDGILWIGAARKLWAVTTGAVSGLAATGYPKRHGDRANSGRD